MKNADVAFVKTTLKSPLFDTLMKQLASLNPISIESITVVERNGQFCIKMCSGIEAFTFV